MPGRRDVSLRAAGCSLPFTRRCGSLIFPTKTAGRVGCLEPCATTGGSGRDSGMPDISPHSARDSSPAFAISVVLRSLFRIYLVYPQNRSAGFTLDPSLFTINPIYNRNLVIFYVRLVNKLQYVLLHACNTFQIFLQDLFNKFTLLTPLWFIKSVD